MRKPALALLCGLLLTSGCSLRDVNEVSLLKYDRSDGVHEIAGKSLVNLPGWTLLGVGFAGAIVLVAGGAAAVAALQSQAP